MLRAATLVVLLSLASVTSAAAQAYQLVWSDEFNGTALDLTKWEPQIGTGCPSLCGWGNNELEYYRAENATVAGGLLTITAKAESFGGKSYTSARLRTKLRGDWTYGRIEMRAKMPTGRGLWPALWMLPTDEVYGAWAASGEIDILEYLGHQTNRVLGTLHYGGAWPNNTYTTNSYQLPTGNFADSFHDFALEWEPCAMRWYVDGVLYATQSNWTSSPAGFPAPFDQRFHLLLNLAVGGNLPGNPDATTVFPQRYIVDHVRVYQRPSLSSCVQVFDGMDHGAPFSNGWFTFNSAIGGGGLDANFIDLPPVDACRASLQTGWGSGGRVGYFGGFGRTRPMDISNATHFSFWIRPDAGQNYRLELNLQDDDNGDNVIPSTPNGLDDEFQYNFVVGPTGPGAIAGGGWQRISIPLSAFTDDNTFHYGGNGILDPRPVSAGGNGQLVSVVAAVVSLTGADASFRTDRWVFTRQTSSIAGRVWIDLDQDGLSEAGEPGLSGVTVQLVDTGLNSVLATQVTPASGAYSFSAQPAGAYEVRTVAATLPAGSTATGDPDGVATPGRFATELLCDQALTARDLGYAVSGLAVEGGAPRSASLAQNAPNPFRPLTTIAFDLPTDDLVELVVLDVAGRPVRTLLRGELPAGTHRSEWDGRDEQGRALRAGVYFSSLITGSTRQVKRMVLLP
jgi:beta-glucanase (GH16 family)